MLYRKTRPVWAVVAPNATSLETLEGKVQVVPGRDVICWRSDVDVWPQRKESLYQAYDSSSVFKKMTVAKIGTPLEFEKFIPKPTALISIRFAHENERPLTLDTGDVLEIDPDRDCIAQKVEINSSTQAVTKIGCEYVVKKTILDENYCRV